MVSGQPSSLHKSGAGSYAHEYLTLGKYKHVLTVKVERRGASVDNSMVLELIGKIKHAVRSSTSFNSRSRRVSIVREDLTERPDDMH